MKKVFITICASLLYVAGAFAQAGRGDIKVSDVELLRTKDYVTVMFTLGAGEKTVRSGYSLVVEPALRNGGSETGLIPVVVQGRKAENAALRHELSSRAGGQTVEAKYIRNGESVRYGFSVPYESWMSGGELVFNGILIGCCSSSEIGLGTVADNILYAEPVFDIRIVEVPVVTPAMTTGEQLASQFSFLAPASDLEQDSYFREGRFDYDMPLNMGRGHTASGQNAIERFIESTREGSISVYFRQGQRDIDSDYSTNSRNLVELISVVRAIEASEDSRISRVVIAGFASPEGALAVNERIAWDRAVALKEFLALNSGVDPKAVRIFNGSVDWAGLRGLVAGSDMYRKNRIIDIIDNTPVWDSQRRTGRLGELMRLDGGEPYRYMLKEFFPQLRSAAYIKVYFENK